MKERKRRREEQREKMRKMKQGLKKKNINDLIQ
jgi:hypothetical protein